MGEILGLDEVDFLEHEYGEHGRFWKKYKVEVIDIPTGTVTQRAFVETKKEANYLKKKLTPHTHLAWSKSTKVKITKIKEGK